MKKEVLKNFWVLLFLCVGPLMYSCSEDDIFEEDENVRSLAKRSMQPFGEDLEPDVVKQIQAGSCSGSSNNGKCYITVSWSQGYTTRYPEATLRGSGTCSLRNGVVTKVSPRWIGNYGIHGTVEYTYEKIVKTTINENVEKTEIVKVKESDSFDFSIRPSFVDDPK